MTIVVKHRVSGQEYILLNTGFNALSNLRPAQFLGDLLPQNEANEQNDRTLSLAVCDYEGRMHCFNTAEMEVLTIDGQKPSDFLPEPPPRPCSTPSTSESTNAATTAVSENPTMGNQVDEFEEDDDWV